MNGTKRLTNMTPGALKSSQLPSRLHAGEGMRRETLAVGRWEAGPRTILELHRNRSRQVATDALPASKTAPAIGLGRILVPLDFSEASRKALRYAGALAAQFGATVCVASIVAPVVTLETLAALGLAESDDTAADKCEARLREMAQDELGDSINAQFEVVVGEPSREILRLARELDAGLIVMSTHGCTGLKRTFLGSMTERVVRQAPCPVLVVREQVKNFVTPESQPATITTGSQVAASPTRRQPQLDFMP